MDRTEYDLTVGVTTPLGVVAANVFGRLPPRGHEALDDPQNDAESTIRSATLAVDGVEHALDVDELQTLATRYGGGWVSLGDILRTRAAEEARA